MKGLYVATDDVKTDAAAGYVSDDGVGRDTSGKDGLHQLGFADEVGVDGGAAGNGLADGREVEATPIIGYADDDVLSKLFGNEGHEACPRLANGFALTGVLDAVVDGVPKEMDDGVLYLLEDAFIQLGVSTYDLKAGFLTSSTSEISNHTWERSGDGVEGEHAHTLHLLLESVNY